ncbi:MAG: hypothetical protein NC344_10155 [Bacteroidales bacterium]|nr:hypothetical protein [Bacteroidales bacterium]MCM1148166.1 hypothetical protein [Bacteroidales bacterium]MCM1207107.1 hypothetical protein [Bacillota bacterium]MCM1510859.1 hypothetical protein [Clostridium sp.]
MKEKILDALKTKFDGVEGKILEKLALKLAKTATTEADVKTAVDGVTFQDVLTSYGDSRADDAQKTAVKNYEKKHGLKDGKAVKAAKTDDDDDDPDEPSWFKAFRKANQEQLDAIKAENETLKAERAKAERIRAITDKAKELGIPEYLMKRISIADDADFEAELASFKQDLVNNDLLPKHGNQQSRTDAQYEAEADTWLSQFGKQ